MVLSAWEWKEQVLKSRSFTFVWSSMVALCLMSGAGRALATPPGEGEPGKALYDTSCSSCHGAQGLGDGKMAPQLKTPLKPLHALLQERNDTEVLDVIANGKGQMPGWGHVLKQPQRTQILQYLRGIQRRHKGK